jgi:hypothetical protein
MAKQLDDPTTIIARLKGAHSGGGWFCNLMLVLGAFIVFAAIIFDTNSVRLAAWGALWTGWNVFWGIGVLQSSRTTFIVYREAPPAN